MVPITLVGTGDLMPNAKEYLLYPGRVKVRPIAASSAAGRQRACVLRPRCPPLIGSAAACCCAGSQRLPIDNHSVPAARPQRSPRPAPAHVQVVIHPAISPKDADTMTSEAYAAIASSLPPELVAPLDEDSE